LIDANPAMFYNTPPRVLPRCSNHLCGNFVRHGIFGELRCADCICNKPGCTDTVKPGSFMCSLHACSEEKCTFLRPDGGNLCSRHTCPIGDSKCDGTDSVPCTAHLCKKCKYSYVPDIMSTLCTTCGCPFEYEGRRCGRPIGDMECKAHKCLYCSRWGTAIGSSFHCTVCKCVDGCPKSKFNCSEHFSCRLKMPRCSVTVCKEDHTLCQRCFDSTCVDGCSNSRYNCHIHYGCLRHGCLKVRKFGGRGLCFSCEMTQCTVSDCMNDIFTCDHTCTGKKFGSVSCIGQRRAGSTLCSACLCEQCYDHKIDRVKWECRDHFGCLRPMCPNLHNRKVPGLCWPCELTKCTFPKCMNDIRTCDHTCVDANCTLPKCFGSTLCSHCQCNQCHEHKIDRTKRDCLDHHCNKNGCDNPMMIKRDGSRSAYCSQHGCSVVGCELAFEQISPDSRIFEHAFGMVPTDIEPFYRRGNENMYPVRASKTCHECVCKGHCPHCQLSGRKCTC